MKHIFSDAIRLGTARHDARRSAPRGLNTNLTERGLGRANIIKLLRLPTVAIHLLFQLPRPLRSFRRVSRFLASTLLRE